jgi:glucose-1-phosphate thymidylyltransferase
MLTPVRAVVLARGKGTRMRQADAAATLEATQAAMADAGLKAMIPFRRPFLDYVLSALADAGCSRVCLVVGPDDPVIKRHYDDHPPSRISVSFATQQHPRGTADAVLSAEHFAGAGPFIALNADNYYPPAVLRPLVTLDGPGLPVFRRSTLVRESNIDPDKVRAYALLRLTPDGFLEDLVEKPDSETAAAFGEDSFVSMNCWRFDAGIFEACRMVEPSSRGEVELPNAVRYAVRTSGMRFRAIPCEVGVLDLSRRSDIPEVERRLAAIDPRP